MIKSFADKATMDLFNGIDSRQARKSLPKNLWGEACELLDLMHAAKHFSELAIPSSHGLHKLKGDRKGQHSVKINNRYRICFRFEDSDFHDVEIVDYH